MSTTAGPQTHRPQPRLFLDDEMLHLRMPDGRRADVPLSAYRRLRNATREQLGNWEIIGDCEGIHWPEIDEDLTIRGLLAYR